MDTDNFSVDTALNSTSFDNESLSAHELYVYFLPSIIIWKKIFIPVWSILGIPGNILAFIVWIRPSMRASSGCVLAALAINDLIFLLLRLVIELQETWRYTMVELPVLCQSFPVAYLATQYLSVFLVLALTIQRYFAVCHPFAKIVEQRSTRRTGLVILSLATVSLGLAAIHGYFWQFHDGSCFPRPEVMEGGSFSVWSIWSWITEMLIFAAVPFIILGLNFRVIIEIERITRRQRETLGSVKLNPTPPGNQNGNASTRSRRNRSGNSPAATTAMLLAVSFYLIGVTLPVTLCYVLYSRYMEGDFNLSTDDIAVDPTWQAHFRYWAARTIIQEIGMSHYAGNFFIYLATGKQFRTELRTVFAAWCRHCRKAVDRSKESLKMRRMSTISVANNNDDKKSNRNGVSVVTVGNADESNDNSRRTGAVAESLCHQDESARVAVRASELERI